MAKRYYVAEPPWCFIRVSSENGKGSSLSGINSEAKSERFLCCHEDPGKLTFKRISGKLYGTANCGALHGRKHWSEILESGSAECEDGKEQMKEV